jgi:hypothetical protein
MDVEYEQTAIAALVLSCIGLAGSASGATVQSIAKGFCVSVLG